MIEGWQYCYYHIEQTTLILTVNDGIFRAYNVLRGIMIIIEQNFQMWEYWYNFIKFGVKFLVYLPPAQAYFYLVTYIWSMVTLHLVKGPFFEYSLFYIDTNNSYIFLFLCLKLVFCRCVENGINNIWDREVIIIHKIGYYFISCG